MMYFRIIFGFKPKTATPTMNCGPA